MEDREFALDETNRAPRGVWSDRTVRWVSDSGQEKLFAHDLATGEGLPERDIAFADRNRDARGIWSDDETMWVLDGGKESLFTYDLASGESLAEYALDDANDDPRGLFSDHGEKRIFAYRLEAGEDGADALERNRDEEFPNTVLSRAGNNSPRGLWSDGDVMYVADESDARVYTYNMPDVIDSRLATLTLSGVDIGEFSPSHGEYEAVVADGVTETTVDAAAMQRRTDVDIAPPDIDEAAEGYQVALEDLGEITVTSADGSRERVYRVRLGEEEVAEPAPEEVAEPAPGRSGRTGGELSARRRQRRFLPRRLRRRQHRGPRGLRAEPERHGPLRAGRRAIRLLPRRRAGVSEPILRRAVHRGRPRAHAADRQERRAGDGRSGCLRGDRALGDVPAGRDRRGLQLVVYEGGSVGELEACAEGVGLAALYVLDDGVWVSYIVGAPEFVNLEFRELFTDGVPVATPLVGKRD